LLEVLQNKRFIRPGTSAFIEADVRVMATSARDVERAINENRLREDLYHQLNAYTIHVPPLRDRKEELPFLSLHFMRRLARHYGLSPREFSPAIIESWQEYNWPGNLRELECCVKRYLMVGDEDLAFGKNRSNPESEAHVVAINRAQSVNQVIPSPAQPGVNVSTSKSLRSLVQNVKREAEKNAISAALERTGWNRKAASRLLKVSYRAMLYKIDEYKLTPSNSLLFLGGNGSRNKAIGLSGNSKAGLARSEGQLS
jgi:DNA-binding NtrC family response regulator